MEMVPPNLFALPFSSCSFDNSLTSFRTWDVKCNYCKQAGEGVEDIDPGELFVSTQGEAGGLKWAPVIAEAFPNKENIFRLDEHIFRSRRRKGIRRAQ